MISWFHWKENHHVRHVSFHQIARRHCFSSALIESLVFLLWCMFLGLLLQAFWLFSFLFYIWSFDFSISRYQGYSLPPHLGSPHSSFDMKPGRLRSSSSLTAPSCLCCSLPLLPVCHGPRPRILCVAHLAHTVCSGFVRCWWNLPCPSHCDVFHFVLSSLPG